MSLHLSSTRIHQTFQLYGISAAVPGPFTLSFRDGAEVNLTCANVTDDNCGSTTWLFSSFLHTTTLFEYGQIHKDISSGSRLSVTEKCSLVIKKVTTTDAGQYTCRHFRSGQNISETSVILFVVSGEYLHCFQLRPFRKNQILKY